MALFLFLSSRALITLLGGQLLFSCVFTGHPQYCNALVREMVQKEERDTGIYMGVVPCVTVGVSHVKLSLCSTKQFTVVHCIGSSLT